MNTKQGLGAGVVVLTALVIFTVFRVGKCALPDGRVGLLSLQHELLRLAPGETSAQAPFEIDGESQVDVHVQTTMQGLAIWIEAPGGQIIDGDTVAGYGGTLLEVQGALEPSGFLPGLLIEGRGYHYAYSFPLAAPLSPGTYTVHAEADPGLTEEVPVIISVTTESPVRVALVVGPFHARLGSPVTLTASVFDATTAVSGATVEVTVLRPVGDPVTVTLVDDGVPPDFEAGDGLYSGTFTPSDVGEHNAVADVSGVTSQGAAFVRTAGTLFEGIAGVAQLTGALRDFAEDEPPGDGYVDRIVVEAQADVFQPGSYGLTVILKRADGRSYLGQNRAVLGVGNGQWMRAEFPAKRFWKDCISGQYTITLVELVEFTDHGAIPLDRIVQESLTQVSYVCEDFHRRPIELTKRNCISATAETLTIDLGVRVTTAGSYHYSGSLRVCTRHAAAVSGDQTLSADANGETLTLTFDASLLGLLGVDGPYELIDLTLRDMEASLSTSYVLDTPAYDARLFTGYQPPSDCNHNGVLDVCEFQNASPSDCNGNGLSDACEFAAGVAADCTGNGKPDDCEIDECNGHYRCDDCQPNGVPDWCEVRSGASIDCNGNFVPDECEPDCNNNGVADACDIAAGTSQDGDRDRIPDECEGNCCVKHGTPGCNDPVCVEAVCADSFGWHCCWTAWDDAGPVEDPDPLYSCANQAAEQCACGDATPTCCVTHAPGSSGCDDAACRDTVCNVLGEGECCTEFWSSACVELAIEHCSLGCCNQDADCKEVSLCDYCDLNTGQCATRPTDCDDQNICTSDSCDPATGCVHTPAPGACDDGNACTQDDQCNNGQCSGTPLPDCTACAVDADCDDIDTCTTDRCEDGVCSYVSQADGQSCDDFDVCTVDESCQAGRCVGTAVPGCVNCENDSQCDDGLSCTQDVCVEGACVNKLPTTAAPVLDGVYDLGGEPHGVAMGNLDDAYGLDLAVTEQTANAVSVFLENGDGTFTLSASYPVDPSPSGVALGDLDGDADLDLVVASRDGDSVSVLLNNGAGVFGTPEMYSVGSNPQGVAIGRLNNDAHPDIAVANQGSSDLSILYNDGGGSFLASIQIGLMAGPSHVTIADLDRKNGNDVIVSMPSIDYIAGLYNDCYGSFAPPSYRSASRARSTAVGDLDGRHELDIVIACVEDASVTVLFGDGQGGWEPVDYYLGGYAVSVTIGDFDGDGDQDIGATLGGDRIVIGYNSYGEFPMPWTELEVMENPTSLGSGDVDGNGAADLAVVSGSTRALSMVRSTIATHCAIAGVCVEAGSANPGDPCEACNPLRSLSQWTPVPSGVYVAGCADDTGTNPQWYCTFDQCVDGSCANTPWLYGDVNHDDVLSLFDILCILEGIGRDFTSCTFLDDDIEPCGGNATLNLFDVFAVLDAIGGSDPCCGRGATGGGGMAPLSVTSIDVKMGEGVTTIISAGSQVEIRAYGDEYVDLRGFEIQVQVTGGTGGTLTLENIYIDDQRADFAFYGQGFFEASNVEDARAVCAMSSGGVSSSEDKYLGTFVFRASQDASGTFTVSAIPGDGVNGTLAGDSAGEGMTVNIVQDASVRIQSW